jgi:hypothetical protein
MLAYYDAMKQWIVPIAVPALILLVVVFLRIGGARKLKRKRQLTCPDCHTKFVVPSLTAVRRWMDFDPESGKHTQSGFSLHCDKCSADYRFTDSFEMVGQAREKTSP